MHSPGLSNPKRSPGGFSLIEVTIALGITAVALVSLMGMLPKGMQVLRAAADKAIEGRIHQQILGELQLTPWEATGGGDSPIDVFDKQVRFYDDQGIELPETDKGSDSHVYTARIHVPNEGDQLPPSVGQGNHVGVMPEGVNSGELIYLRLVIVEITSIVDQRFLDDPVNSFDKSEYQKHIRTFRTIISKMGQEYDPSSGTDTP